MVIWILGLSGSGKTTLANIISNKLKKRIIHIDGDLIREMYEKKIGYTLNDRLLNAGRISRLVKILSKQKVNIVVSVLSNFPVWLNWNRKNIKKYFEIYLKTDIKILKKRKPNLYNKKKNIVGIDIKFREPKKSNLIINNCNDLNELKLIADKIIKKTKLLN